MGLRLTEQAPCCEEWIVDKRLGYGVWADEFRERRDIADGFGRAQGQIMTFLLNYGLIIADYTGRVEKDD